MFDFYDYIGFGPTEIWIEEREDLTEDQKQELFDYADCLYNDDGICGVELELCLKDYIKDNF